MYEGGTKIFFNKRRFFHLFDLQFKAYSFSKQRLRLSYSTSTQWFFVYHSWSSWNLKMLVSEERGKPEYPEKNL